MSMSKFLKNTFIDVTLRYSDKLVYYPQPPYVALYTTNPTEDDTGSELSGSGYKRQIYPVNETTISQGSARNYTSITFPQASGSWIGIGYFGIRSGSEAGANSGSLLFFGKIDLDPIGPTTLTVNEGNTLVIPTNSLAVDIEGASRSYTSDAILYQLLVNSYPQGSVYSYLAAPKYIGLFHEAYSGEYETQYTVDIFPRPAPVLATLTEVNAAGYARVLSGDWHSSTSGSTYNTSNIVITVGATTDWGEIRSIGLNWSPTSGSFFFVTNLSASRTMKAGDSFAIDTGSLVLRVI